MPRKKRGKRDDLSRHCSIAHLMSVLKGFTLYSYTRPCNVDLSVKDGRVTMGRPFKGPVTLGGSFLPGPTCPSCNSHVGDDLPFCPECWHDLSEPEPYVFRARLKEILDRLAIAFIELREDPDQDSGWPAT